VDWDSSSPPRLSVSLAQRDSREEFCGVHFHFVGEQDHVGNAKIATIVLEIDDNVFGPT
jgi:hypothetical protein